LTASGSCPRKTRRRSLCGRREFCLNVTWVNPFFAKKFPFRGTGMYACGWLAAIYALVKIVQRAVGQVRFRCAHCGVIPFYPPVACPDKAGNIGPRPIGPLAPVAPVAPLGPSECVIVAESSCDASSEGAMAAERARVKKWRRFMVSSGKGLHASICGRVPPPIR
jgi:hypothetical protein